MLTYTKKNKVNTRSKKEGMTIAETLVALFLFAMFIGGACKVIMSHRQVADTSRDHYTALNIARNQLEQVRNTRERIGYDQIYEKEEVGTRVSSNGDPDDKGRFMRITSISDVNSTNLSEVTIMVQIQDRVTLGFSTNNMQEITSYISKTKTQ